MASSGPVGVGFIGTGMISTTYLENLTRFPDVKVVALGDLNTEVARAQAERFGIPTWGSPDEVLAHPEVELVVNLTLPAFHAEVASRAVAAGKHVWSEKPISTDRESGRELLAQAAAAGVLVGCAPDTVLGPGVQSARRAIARGDIGEPLSAQTVMQYAGPDIFHPNPDFYFAPGGGPVLDMGPYYLTTLVQVFGSVGSIAAFGGIGRGQRSVQVGPRTGQTFDVTVPTFVSAIASYVDGGVSQSLFSFESPLKRQGVVEITGTEGTLVVPDPNRFTGEVRIARGPVLGNATTPEEVREVNSAPQTWEDVEVKGVYAERGLGVLDLARAARTGGRPLASGDLAYHVLDTLLAIEDSVREGRVVDVESRVDRVPLVADDFDPFASTL
ncbi:Gfo/Idh/MocA family protein [Microlunatus flavus]|uniref:Predicted dehydrogenase n=1 Tax=Microlunatus flavus TaxID=1036181 RepID=A0A1H8ZF82_9ACTN|nr:Gfo/Idh/MocA family oxidoreductase [Microlunatus flavus]SEP63129.1 Predicted dehydrogenase [Microlunatus flavus]